MTPEKKKKNWWEGERERERERKMELRFVLSGF